MRLHCAAFVAAIAVMSVPAHARQPDSLSLDEAFRRALAAHPELARFNHRRAVLDAELQQAGLGPPLTARADLENFAGSGDLSGLEQAEFTLSLASVLESNARRAARTAVAQSNLDALVLTEEARRLDLLAEVARRYLDGVAAQELELIAADELRLREQTVAAAAQRVRTGAAPDSTRLAAVAAAARARLEQERARGLRLAAMRRLAIAMGRRDSDFDAVQGDLYALPEISGFETLAALLERSPELGRFADERRLREARLQLVQASARADWEWQLGVRRLEESDDWAAVAGLAVPLGTRSRAAPAVRAAQAELAELELARDTEQLALHATLVEAYLRLRAAAAEAAFTTTELLPALEQAASAMERAYRAGAANYLDWALVQAEHADARRERLAAALEARKALIEIQRLTGEPFVKTPVAAIGEGIDP